MVDQITKYAKDIGAYNEFIYLNYADKSQNVLQGYGAENLDYLRRVAQQYDPSGAFQTQVPGGYKVTSA